MSTLLGEVVDDLRFCAFARCARKIPTCEEADVFREVVVSPKETAKAPLHLTCRGGYGISWFQAHKRKAVSLIGRELEKVYAVRIQQFIDAIFIEEFQLGHRLTAMGIPPQVAVDRVGKIERFGSVGSSVHILAWNPNDPQGKPGAFSIVGSQPK